MATPTELVGGVVKWKYFDLSGFGLYGRGGAVKVFLLAAGVDFEEELVDFTAWTQGGLKEQAIESGENPAGYLPIMRVGDKKMCECYATMRYLSKKLGLYGKDDDLDYKIDSMADEAMSWREPFVQQLFADEKVKESYKAARPKYYKAVCDMIELYGGSGACLVGDKLSYADAVMFALVADDAAAFGKEELELHPKLSTFMSAFAQLPGMKAAGSAFA